MPDLKCEIQNESGNELTVGTVFYIICDGDVSSLDAKAELRLDKGDEYKLKLLSLDTKDHLKLKVTSYVPGEHQLKAIQLVSESSSVVLGDLHFSVKSVINHQEPTSEPFGPRGPMEFGLPLWYWITWVLLLSGIIFVVTKKIINLRRTKRRIAELSSLLQGQTPFHYFSATIRKTSRQHPFLTDLKQEVSSEKINELLSDLEKTYRVFIGTQFQVDALNIKDKKLAEQISKKIASGEAQVKIKNEILKLFNEFSRARGTQDKVVSAKDCVQIFEQLKKNVDQLFESFEEKRKRARP